MSDPTTSTAREGSEAPVGHARVLLHAVPWSTYEALLTIEDENPGVRMTYCEGRLEIMSPSGRHENVKTMLARLLEAYAEEHDLEFNGFGSTTFRDEQARRGLEPDECYVLSEVADADPRRPDLAIEVAISSWSIDRLDVYAGLGVPEVWLWRAARLDVFVLGTAGYAQQPRSALLPELDLVELAAFATRPDQTAAVKAYRARLRG